MITVERKMRFGTRGSANEVRKTAAKGRIPRVARLMALAIRCEKLIRDGVVADQSELARFGHITSARMTQIMALLNLAPDLQGQILHLPRVGRGSDPVKETDALPIAERGLVVKTGLAAGLQRAANDARDRGLRRLDKLRGYRTPARNLVAENVDLETTPRWRSTIAPARSWP